MYVNVKANFRNDKKLSKSYRLNVVPDIPGLNVRTIIDFKKQIWLNAVYVFWIYGLILTNVWFVQSKMFIYVIWKCCNASLLAHSRPIAMLIQRLTKYKDKCIKNDKDGFIIIYII